MRTRSVFAALIATMATAWVAAPAVGQTMTQIVEDLLRTGILQRYQGYLFAPHVDLGNAGVLAADLRNNLVFEEIDDPDLQGRYLPAMLPLESNTLQIGTGAVAAIRDDPVTLWHEFLHHQISLRGGEECGPEEAYNYLQEARVSWLDQLRQFDSMYRATPADPTGCPRLLSAWAGREQRWHDWSLDGPYSGQDPRGACGAADAVYTIDPGFIDVWDMRLNIFVDLAEIRSAYAEKLDACAGIVSTDVDALLATLRQADSRAAGLGAEADQLAARVRTRLDEVETNRGLIEQALVETVQTFRGRPHEPGVGAVLDTPTGSIAEVLGLPGSEPEGVARSERLLAELSDAVATAAATAMDRLADVDGLATEACGASGWTAASTSAAAAAQLAEQVATAADEANERYRQFQSLQDDLMRLAAAIDRGVLVMEDAATQLDRLDGTLIQANGEIDRIRDLAQALDVLEDGASTTHMKIASALQVAPPEPARARAIRLQADALIRAIRVDQAGRVEAMSGPLATRQGELQAALDELRTGLAQMLAGIEERYGATLVIYEVDRDAVLAVSTEANRARDAVAAAARRAEEAGACADEQRGVETGDDATGGAHPGEGVPRGGDTDGRGNVAGGLGDGDADDGPDEAEVTDGGDRSAEEPEGTAITADLDRYRRLVTSLEAEAERMRRAAAQSAARLATAASSIAGLREELGAVRRWLGRLELPHWRETLTMAGQTVSTPTDDAIDAADEVCRITSSWGGDPTDRESVEREALTAMDRAWRAVERAEERLSASARVITALEDRQRGGTERTELAARIDRIVAPPMSGESELAAARLIEIDLTEVHQRVLQERKPEADALWIRLADALGPGPGRDASELEPWITAADGLRRRQLAAETQAAAAGGDERRRRRADLDNELAVLRADFMAERDRLDRLQAELEGLDAGGLRDRLGEDRQLVSIARNRATEADRCLDDLDPAPTPDADAGDASGTGDGPAGNPFDEAADAGIGAGAGTGSTPRAAGNPFDEAADAGTGPGGGEVPPAADVDALVTATEDALQRCDYAAARRGIDAILRADPSHPELGRLTVDFGRRTSAEVAGYQLLERAQRLQHDLDAAVDALQEAMNAFPCPKPGVNEAIAAVVGEAAGTARRDATEGARSRRTTWTSILGGLLDGMQAVTDAIDPPRGGSGGADATTGSGGGVSGGATGGGGTAPGRLCGVHLNSAEGEADLYWVLFEIESGAYTGYYVVAFSREPGSPSPEEWIRGSGQAMAQHGGSPPRELARGSFRAMEARAYALCPR